MSEEQFGDMWDAATRDLDAEADARAYTQARIETVNLWPFLARAETREDYENRKALLIPKVAGKIEDPQLRDRVLAAWDEDYAIIHPTAGVTCPACGSPRQERHHLNTEGRQGYTCKKCNLSWDMPRAATLRVAEDEDHRYVTTNDGAVLDVHHSRLGGMFVATCERCGITIAAWDDEEELKSHVCDPEDIAKRNEIYGSKTAGEGDDSTKPAMDGTGVEKTTDPNAGGSVGSPADSEKPPPDDTLTDDDGGQLYPDYRGGTLPESPYAPHNRDASLEVLLGVAEGENPTDWLDKDAWPPLVPVESEPKDESVPEVGGSQEGGFAQIGEPAGAKFSAQEDAPKPSDFVGKEVEIYYRARDIGYGEEEGEFWGRITGESDSWGKWTVVGDRVDAGKTLYLFEDEFVDIELADQQNLFSSKKKAANDPDYHKIMQDNRNDKANKPSKRPPSMPTPTDTRCGKCGYLVHPGSSAGPCPSCGAPVRKAATRKTAETSWDTDEVARWFDNDEGLYFGSAGMTDPDEFREMWEGSTPNETVNSDNVDWNAVAQSRHEGSKLAADSDGDGDEDAEGQKKYPEVSTEAPENDLKPKDGKIATEEWDNADTSIPPGRATGVCHWCGEDLVDGGPEAGAPPGVVDWVAGWHGTKYSGDYGCDQSPITDMEGVGPHETDEDVDRIMAKFPGRDEKAAEYLYHGVIPGLADGGTFSKRHATVSGPLDHEASLVCNECGRKFSHKLAADTFEIECPGCGGFDTDLSMEAGGNPFTPENNPMGSGGAGDTSGGMNDNPMDQGMDTETPGAPAEVKTPVTTRPRGGETDMTQPAGGAQPGGGVTQGFASRSAT